jgi:hypothetical protein
MQDTTNSQLVEELRKIDVFNKQKFKKETSLESLASFFESLDEKEQNLLRTMLDISSASSIRKIRRKLVYETVDSETLKEEKLNMKQIFEMPESDFEELVSKLNKKYPSRVLPSYYKIKDLLENFKKTGLVLSRDVKERKAETLWYVEPKFVKIYLTIKNDLERKLKNNTITDTEVSLYQMLTGSFLRPIIKVKW